VPSALSVRGLTKAYDSRADERSRLYDAARALRPRGSRADHRAAMREGGGSPEAGPLIALEDFDLEVPAGRFFGLLGPNGAGKTTLISAVCNIIRVTAGEIDVFGEPHDTLVARRMIGLAEQDVNLDRFLDVEETLMYHGGYFGMSRSDARRRAGEMMDVFDLRAKAGVRAPKLSGGMRRRLLIARALMHEPRLVILDEPTAGVDFELRIELWAYIRRLHDGGTTVLLTTHYLEEADELCEEIALIRDGRVIARDSADGLRRAYDAASLADVYVKAMAGMNVGVFDPRA
jgi:ABC-2 type transport system ATP-binding protein